MKSWKNNITLVSMAVAIISTASFWAGILLTNTFIPPIADFFYAHPYHVAGGTFCVLFAIVRWTFSE